MLDKTFKTTHTFERSELRTLQNICEGDNEMFLNYIADNIGKLSEKLDIAESIQRTLENELMMSE